MKLLAWSMALGTLIILMIEAVALQRATVCRQIAWQKSVEVLTRATLTHAKNEEKQWHLSCQLVITRKEQVISWRRLPRIKDTSFFVNLKGKL